MSDALPIVLFGAAGRMGRMITQLAAAEPDRYQIVAAVDQPDHPLIGRPLAELVPGAPAEVQLAAAPPDQPPAGAIAVHFMLPAASIVHLDWSRRHAIPTLVGTTGFNEEQLSTLKAAAADAAILLSPNTSRGVNVLFWLARQATRLLGPGCDIEIVEMHHHHKRDAPSGTAARLAQVVAEVRGADYDRDVCHGRHGDVGARPAGEIGIHALRGGDVVGEHTLILAGRGERLELTHRAQSRDLLAAGALDAARWLKGRSPGFYSMDDMLGLA